jgi:hypothetical protein
VTYPGTIPLSRAHLTHLAGLLRTHRKQMGSRWRRLDPGRQALLVLAHLRNGDTSARLAAGFAIGVTTVWRYIREAVDLLAQQAPTLTAALWRLAHNGHALGILDGTVVPIDRVGGPQDRRYYSGCKHRRHGVNLQALVDPRRGELVWISPGLPGSTHDLTAARIHRIILAATRGRGGTAGRQGISGCRRHGDHPVQGPAAHHGATGTQPDGPQPARTRRARVRHTGRPADLHQGPLLPAAGRSDGQRRTRPRTRTPVIAIN